MKLSNGNYANWSAIVNKLEPTPGSLVVFYRVDTSIGKVAEVWAVFDTGPNLVYGEFGNQGPLTATFTGVYTGAVAVTTTIGVTES